MKLGRKMMEKLRFDPSTYYRNILYAGPENSLFSAFRKEFESRFNFITEPPARSHSVDNFLMFSGLEKIEKGGLKAGQEEVLSGGLIDELDSRFEEQVTLLQKSKEFLRSSSNVFLVTPFSSFEGGDLSSLPDLQSLHLAGLFTNEEKARDGIRVFTLLVDRTAENREEFDKVFAKRLYLWMMDSGTPTESLLVKVSLVGQKLQLTYV